ncbi:MAG: hypothetical protein IPH12_11140 [Saprospirales bacterium]|nr:hypothetical protein [Saprospirales bacterium]
MFHFHLVVRAIRQVAVKVIHSNRVGIPYKIQKPGALRSLRRCTITGFWILSIQGVFFSQKPLAARPASLKPSKPAAEYLQIITEPGDNVTTVLERFELAGYDCNISAFFQINKLREDYRLKANTLYKIPVMVVPYDGKTIRSSLKIDDWQTAIRIDAYNKSAQEKGLRERSFIEDKQPGYRGMLCIARKAAALRNRCAPSTRLRVATWWSPPPPKAAGCFRFLGKNTRRPH